MTLSDEVSVVAPAFHQSILDAKERVFLAAVAYTEARKQEEVWSTLQEINEAVEEWKRGRQ